MQNNRLAQSYGVIVLPCLYPSVQSATLFFYSLYEKFLPLSVHEASKPKAGSADTDIISQLLRVCFKSCWLYALKWYTVTDTKIKLKPKFYRPS